MMQTAIGQTVDDDLLYIKKRMDSISQFSAQLRLDLDVPFIQMPTKNASVTYKKGEEMAFSSEDFVMLPKRGLDFSLNEIFKYPFITVNRGTEVLNGKKVKVLKIIPDDAKSSLALATLYLDVKNKRILASNIISKKDGSYDLQMKYKTVQDILPSHVEVSFAIEKLKIPLNFMGSDTKIDRKQLRDAEVKTGKILMAISEYKIVK
ncbi:hypothetical protein KIV10_09340 [Aequorivita echinoideorum]|uniref:HlyD family secretion protein n=2 Tax=Aequorivita echinoideorum TaxID=1549647 RepID=A0ABS5S7I6_9FLAO|nr:hypothetical protein [Aequorivita echinoideorum]